MRRMAAALIHHPVLDREQAVVTTAVTNLDLHDLARSARCYGLSDVFIVHPIQAQRTLVERVREHWISGSGARRIPDRTEAIRLLRVVSTLAEAIAALGPDCELWVTSARALPGAMDIAAARDLLRSEGPPLLLAFGTGWGLAESVVVSAKVCLAPLTGSAPDGYNHLSVRAAAAILFDRLLGDRA
ncbi:MAG TPA: RNA methyltransferase [Polyangiaceae bacterium]